MTVLKNYLVIFSHILKDEDIRLKTHTLLRAPKTLGTLSHGNCNVSKFEEIL